MLVIITINSEGKGVKALPLPQNRDLESTFLDNSYHDCQLSVDSKLRIPILIGVNIVRKKGDEIDMEQIDPKKLKRFPKRFQNLIRVLVTAINLYDPELVYNLLDIIPDRWEELKPLMQRPGQGTSRGKIIYLSECRGRK